MPGAGNAHGCRASGHDPHVHSAGKAPGHCRGWSFHARTPSSQNPGRGAEGWSRWGLQPTAALPSPLLASQWCNSCIWQGLGRAGRCARGDAPLAQANRGGAGAAAGRLSHPQRAAECRAEVPPPVSPAWCWRLRFQEHFQLLSQITKCQCCTNRLCGGRRSTRCSASSGSAVPPETTLRHRGAQLKRGVHHGTRSPAISHTPTPQPGPSRCSGTPELPHREQEPCPWVRWRHRLGKSRSVASITLQKGICPAGAPSVNQTHSRGGGEAQGHRTALPVLSSSSAESAVLHG